MTEPETAARDTTPLSFDEIVPVVRKYAQRCIKDEETQALALTLAWYRWEHSGKKYLPASVWALVGVRQALSGRDIPGIKSKFRDAMKHRETQGAGMEGLAERRPGPVRTLIAREDAERFFAGLDDFEREMADLLADGMPNHLVAARLNRTAGAISQRRRRLMERHADQ